MMMEIFENRSPQILINKVDKDTFSILDILLKYCDHYLFFNIFDFNNTKQLPTILKIVI